MHRGDKLQVVFGLDEWQETEKLLVAFVKSKAPARGESKRQELGPRWVPPPYSSPQLSEEKSEKRRGRQQTHSLLPPLVVSSRVSVCSMRASVGSAHPSRRSSKQPNAYTYT